jgi:hypothetical protein
MLVDDDDWDLHVLFEAQARFPELREIIDQNHEHVGAFRQRAVKQKNAKQLFYEERRRRNQVVATLTVLLMSDPPPKDALRRAVEALAMLGQWCNSVAW